MKASAPTAVPVVLASASPRRRDLLTRIGLEPTVRPATVDERPRPGERADDHVLRLAGAKADAVLAAPRSGPDAADDARALIVAADTVVELDGTILGKPGDAEQARAMLTALSGRGHRVLTGVAVRHRGRAAQDVAITEVRFRTLEPATVDAYVAGGAPMDKAGAYGIQGAAGLFVEGIVGSDSNVVGLPLGLLAELSEAVGVTLVPSGGAVLLR